MDNISLEGKTTAEVSKAATVTAEDANTSQRSAFSGTLYCNKEAMKSIVDSRRENLD